jgi:predicted NAD-dependent protein-ADP-ribosyltransferase YbiA (DUF1768 family)
VAIKHGNLMQVETDDMILFWQADSVFSNWYQPVTIRYDDHVFENSEALFMYMKANTFEDEGIKKAILANQNPAAVKLQDVGLKTTMMRSGIVTVNTLCS